VLTDLMFIDRGHIVFNCSMEELEGRYFEVMVQPDNLDTALALRPIHQRQVFGRTILMFEGAEGRQLEELGEVRTPGVADLFVAVMSRQPGRGQGAVQ
jgi:ABC-2 type transport system ATP-binding protein